MKTHVARKRVNKLYNIKAGKHHTVRRLFLWSMNAQFLTKDDVSFLLASASKLVRVVAVSNQDCIMVDTLSELILRASSSHVFVVDRFFRRRSL